MSANDKNTVASTSATTLVPDIKIKPQNRAILKTLKDLEVRKARAEHHGTQISTSINEGKTIPGLRREVRPQIPDVPVDLAIKWEEAHITFTDTLTGLLAEYWSSKKDTIDTEIATTTHRLSVNGTSAEEIKQIQLLSTEAGTSETTKLQTPKPQRQRQPWKQAFKRVRRDGDSSRGQNSAN